MGAVAGQVHIFQMDGIVPFHHGDFTGTGRTLGFADFDGAFGIDERGSFPGGVDGTLAHGDAGTGGFRGQGGGTDPGGADVDVVRGDLAPFGGVQTPGGSAGGPDVGIVELHAALGAGGEHRIGPVRFRADGAAIHGEGPICGQHGGILAVEFAPQHIGGGAAFGNGPVGQCHLRPVLHQQGAFVRYQCRIAVRQGGLFSADHLGGTVAVRRQRFSRCFGSHFRACGSLFRLGRFYRFCLGGRFGIRSCPSLMGCPDTGTGQQRGHNGQS